MLIKLKNKNSKNDTIKQFFEAAIFLVIPIAYIVGSFSINLITVLIWGFFYKSSTKLNNKTI